MIYNIVLDIQRGNFSAEQAFNATSNEAEQDTFKPNIITMVPHTTIAIVTLSDSGIFLYDVSQMKVIRKISLIEINNYYPQD